VERIVATNDPALLTEGFEDIVIARHGGGVRKGGPGPHLEAAGFVNENGFFLNDLLGHAGEPTGILEAFEVKNDGAGCAILTEVFQKIRDFQHGLVAAADKAAESISLSLGQEHEIISQGPALGNKSERSGVRSFIEGQVQTHRLAPDAHAIRPDQGNVRFGGDPDKLLLQFFASGTDLGKARGDDDGPADSVAQAFPKGFSNHGSRKDKDGQVDGMGKIGDFSPGFLAAYFLGVRINRIDRAPEAGI
jgi:hypothetical protein